MSLLWVQQVQRHQRVLSLQKSPTGTRCVFRFLHYQERMFKRPIRLRKVLCSDLQTVTYSRSRQTLHAGESSVSLVASLSSLTSLSSVSLCTSRALNESNRRSVSTRPKHFE